MPEGDSVHRLAARLRRAADGRTVADGELRSGDAAGSSLEGLRILEHDTHGKHLLTRFSGDLTLHTHLRMQGSWTVTSPGRAVPRAVQKDVRVRLRLDDGVTLWGVDLPVVELLPTRDEARAVGHLGPDPLRTDWSAEEAVARLSRTPERPVVAALLDQRLMAGLGNLWANEICFLRGLFPWRPVGTVDVRALVATAARGLRASVTVPGMFQTTTGDTRRGERHWVAGRAGRPCLRCGTTVLVRAEVRDDPEQRRTWWCPHCQPELP
ncbi:MULTISPECIES: Fpg/Nei family DNA glycosylase [unclassified Rathayibacter]|uniref:Fpg/Nei family DNA glycosylase n=1 Tax=unclassified Rathayibacter TaxID=2609250 RepID=UPI001FB27388|nr:MULTISPECIES: DNA-formamidopyrimidine glycosylase family protein [unclassified Rathayibacter]MCJ1672212.1 Fpg/Nei family DNA glycosylase [Rathayibacter sp. VKM Ac-2929]MCJ1683597.1 Fpg/Nei family DNA glycosylase [Rathayibacter sp. VKM Ac-2928]